MSEKSDWFTRRKVKESPETQTAQKLKSVRVNTVIQVKPNCVQGSWRGVLAFVMEIDDLGVKVLAIAPDRGQPTLLCTHLPWDNFVVIGMGKWLPIPR